MLLKFGVLLILASFIPWLLLPVVAWLAPTPAEKATQSGLLILAGEVLFWTGTLMAGREVWTSAKEAGWKKLLPTLLKKLR
jgi:hypothetical protein